MNSTSRLLALASMTAGVLVFGFASGVQAQDDTVEIPFDDADVYAELNNTDRDIGFHALIDGDDWKKLAIEDPNERNMLKVNLRGRLRRQGLTELFFESAEPNFEDQSPEEFFALFPEGEYEIEGITLDGEELESVDEFSHLMPAPAADVMVNGDGAAENCDVEPLPSTTAPVTISWTVPPLSHPEVGRTNEPIEIETTQLVMEELDGDAVISIDLPADVTSYEFSEDFSGLADTWKYEILLIADDGNRTAVESCFDLE